MKALFALLVAACATTIAASPASSVAGCWIQRDDAGGATTMRWLRDLQRPGALNGDLLVYASSGATQSARYRLEPRDGAWALCEAAAERGWPAVQRGETGREVGHALIESQPEFLRISIVVEGANRIVFEGARDGCD